MGQHTLFTITLVRFTLFYPKAQDKKKINLESVFSRRMALVINSFHTEILIALS